MEKAWSKFAVAGFIAALIVVTLAIVSGFGHRWGWWDFGWGFTLLKFAFYGSFVAMVLSLMGGVFARPGANRRGFVLAICGIAISIAVAYVPWNEKRKASSLPLIHDISTDTQNPPEFIAVLPMRGANSNSTVYAGSAIAELQLKGYPDIQPLLTDKSPEIIFNQALDAAKRLHWEIAAADPVAGRIEATDTTFWYGFKDDIVIRITAQPEGSRVDIRSVSRVGRSDVGANAARIRAFFKALER